jgi:hypothetical protein
VRTSGCTCASSSARAAGSANTLAPNAARSTCSPATSSGPKRSASQARSGGVQPRGRPVGVEHHPSGPTGRRATSAADAMPPRIRDSVRRSGGSRAAASLGRRRGAAGSGANRRRSRG